MPETAKIRNVAVVGHRGTGKTSLVEALLFQSGAVNRLGTVEAGTTISDADEDEHKRQASIAMSVTHATWQERKLNLIDIPGRSELPGRAANRRTGRRGDARHGVGGDGRRGGYQPSLAARRGARACAPRFREHARPRAGRLLPNARTASLAALEPVRCRAHPHRSRARADRHRRRPAHVRVLEPRGREGSRAGPDPGRDGGRRGRVPREAPRRRRRDGRGAHGALPRRPGARRPRGRVGAQGRGDERGGLSRGMRRCDQEPRHARSARPARRGRSLAGEEVLVHRRRRRRAPRSSSSRPSPIRSPAGSTSSVS